MNDSPEPLTPLDCDLRDFQFMPLDVVRLRDSELASNETPEACWAATLLWCASWHQVPAGSIPDDEMWIATQARYAIRGKIDKAWKSVRSGALRGWIKCSDGRFYHPVVAEKAREAWAGKHRQRHKTECARIKKHNQRHGTKIPFPTLDEFLSSEYVDPTQGDIRKLSPGTQQQCPQDVHRETQSKGQGEGQGYVNPSGSGITTDSGHVRDDAFRVAAAAALVEELRKNDIAIGPDDMLLAESWHAVGATPADVAAAIGKAHARRTKKGSLQPINIGFIDTLLGEVLAARRAASGKPFASTGRWHQSWSGIVAYGRELDVEQTDGEPDAEFKLRVFNAAGDGPWWAEHFPQARGDRPVSVGTLLRGGHAA
ncbi:DUF1376 domain-containing protein [Paraburkholderia youngii]|uniref:DUF1376 domain-containing protein n=1 Tax=Paraburkholderia youngii TaxID=2782701 RepID=UPI003D1E355A